MLERIWLILISCGNAILMLTIVAVIFGVFVSLMALFTFTGQEIYDKVIFWCEKFYREWKGR